MNRERLERIALASQREIPVDSSLNYNADGQAGRPYESVRRNLSSRPEGALLEALRDKFGSVQQTPLDTAVAVASSRSSEPLGLDLGCGWGRYVSEAPGPMVWFGADMKRYVHWDLSSINGDPAASYWDNLYSHAPPERFIVSDAHKLDNIPDNSFHLVASFCAFTYTCEPKALESVHRVLAPGGVALLHALNYDVFPEKNVYAVAATSREAAFSDLRNQGVPIEVVKSPNSAVIFMEKTDKPLRFPSELTNCDAVKTYSMRF